MTLVSNAAILWAVRVLTLLSSGCLSILTARALGPGGRGLYVMPAVDASLATTLAAGLSSAAVYFIVTKGANTSFVRSAAIVLTLFIGIGFCLTAITAGLTRSPASIIPALTFVLSYSFYSLAYGFYLGFNRAKFAAALNAAAYLLTLLLVSLGLYINRTSPVLAIAGWVAGMGTVGIIGLAMAFRDSSSLTGIRVGSKEVLQFALRAGLVNLVNLLNYRIDIFIVAIVTSTATLGLYTLAVTGAEAILSMTQALSQAALPRIGSLDAREAGTFTARCLRNSILFASILATIAFIGAPIVIQLIFGQAYLSIIAPLRVLLVGLIAASTTSIISNYFMINQGRTHVPLITSCLSVMVCAAISIVLVPRIGMLGAALGSTIAYIVSQTLGLILFTRESGVPLQSTLVVNRIDIAFYGRLLRRLTARGAH